MKRIITCLLSAVMLCTSSAYAVNVSKLDISWENPRTFSVEGTADSKKSGERISFQVLNPGKAMTDLAEKENPSKDYFVKLYQTTTGENGEFAFSFDMENATDKSGEFTLRIKNSSESGEAKDIKFYYYSKPEVDSLSGRLAANMGKQSKDDGAVSAIGTILTTEARNMFFNDFPLYDSVVFGGAVNDVSESLSYMPASTDGKQMMQNIRLAVVLAAAENNKISPDSLFDDYSKDLNITENAEYLAYKGYTAAYKNSFDAFFNTQKNKKMLRAEDYTDLFKKSVVLTELAKSNGTGGVRDTLEKFKEYFDLTKYSQSKYRNEICDKIAKGFESKSINSLLDVQTLLDTEIKDNPPINGGGSGGGGSSGGSSDGGKKMTMPSYASAGNGIIQNENTDVNLEEKSAFTDLDNFDWVKEEIEYLADRGVISGYSKQIFAPGDNLSRAQACTIICKVFSLNDDALSNVFEDIKDDDWYKNFVMSAYQAGIVYGYTDSLFGAEKPITRQDFVVMMTRALDKYGVNLKPADDDSTFADQELISDYAIEGVKKFKHAAIISGKGDNEFDPLGNITRAEAAKIIYRVKNIYEGRE